MMLSLQGSSCNLHWLRAYYITGDEAHGSSIFAKIAQAELDGKTTFPLPAGRISTILLIWMNWSGKGFLQKKNVLPAAGEMTPAMWIMKKYITADFHF